MSEAGDAIAYHETLAAGWSQRYAAGGFQRRAAFFRHEVMARLAPMGDWLDVGCGSGVFSRMLGAAGANVLGLDGSPAMVAAAQAAGGGRYEVGRVEDVAALQQVFDGVICLSVLEYVAEPAAVMSAIASRLKPGGRVAVSLPNRGSTLRWAQRLARPLARPKSLNYLDSSRHLWSRPEAAALAQAAGLKVEAIVGFDPVAPRALWPVISPSLWFVVARRAE